MGVLITTIVDVILQHKAKFSHTYHIQKIAYSHTEASEVLNTTEIRCCIQLHWGRASGVASELRTVEHCLQKAKAQSEKYKCLGGLARSSRLRVKGINRRMGPFSLIDLHF
jgi:hypothetical protein